MRTELIESIGALVRRQAAAHGKRALFIEDDRIVSYAEVPKAFIVCKEGASLAEAALLAHCRRQIAAYKLPRVVDLRARAAQDGVGHGPALRPPGRRLSQ